MTVAPERDPGAVPREEPAGAPATAPEDDGRWPRVGVDIGGTFTDFVVFDGSGEGGGGYRTLKVLSTPDDPARAVLVGLQRAGLLAGGDLVHGSTVATNAVLERKGARTAFVTSEGFGDLLELARQDRRRLYELAASRPEPLVPPEDCHTVAERVDRDGQVLRPVDEAGLRRLADELRRRGVDSVAVCFLFSFLHTEHEERAEALFRDAGLHVSRSSEVLPEFREYERASTTVMNAYVAPLLDRYLERLEGELDVRSFRIMQSNGGSVGTDVARSHGVRSVLSGPAGGAVGALRVAREAGFEQAISFDMGGTSTDISLMRGRVEVTAEAEIDGLPIRVPVIDIHTVGAGGGSIARVDAGGALRVGPESAGADPGPACYGRGGARPTVTDANVVLGRLPPGAFLGGEMELDAGAATRALEGLAEAAGVRAAGGLTATQRAALGVVRVANARMERALRVISVQRGHEPSDFVLVSFGGAGGLHAAALARRLGVATVLVPPAASVLSAFGMLSADVVKDYVRTVMLPGETSYAELERRAAPLRDRGRREVTEEGVPQERIRVEATLDVRYEGQSYELDVPLAEDFAARFHAEHRRVYGHASPETSVEVVNVRVRAVGRVDPPPLRREEAGSPDPGEARTGERPVVLEKGSGGGRVREVPVYDGERLRAGHRLAGPCVVTKRDTTVYLGPRETAGMDVHRNLRVHTGMGVRGRPGDGEGRQ